jgi:hypothetical protein
MPRLVLGARVELRRPAPVVWAVRAAQPRRTISLSAVAAALVVRRWTATAGLVDLVDLARRMASVCLAVLAALVARRSTAMGASVVLAGTQP